MSWREQLRDAAFRGVPFLVSGHEADVGRRVQVHEFPQRDKPYAEDLGRKARTISVDAFVLGADYMAARDRLLAAVEAAGPGRLVHPYLGELTVTVTACSLRESTAEGGMARFALQMVESGEAVFPNALASTGDAVRVASEVVTEVALQRFTQTYSLARQPEFVVTSAMSTLNSALTGMQGAAGQVQAVADKVAQLAQGITLVKQQLISVVFSPASTGQAIVDNAKLLAREVAYGPREALAMARTLFRFGSDLPNVPTNTATRRQQAANQAAMTQLVRVATAAEAAGAATGIAFDSYQDALAIRAELLDAMDALLETTGLDDAVFDALRMLRNATVRDITTRGADLARVVPYTPAQTLPALVVAHHLYADAARAEEIITRNRLMHPGFVRGQRTLEVLTDG